MPAPCLLLEERTTFILFYAQDAARRRRRRSRSDRPPQIPKRSSFMRAYSKHSARTSQDAQTPFASRVEPPFSGKNASGSVCAHSASCCQESGPSSELSRASAPCTTVNVMAPSPKMFHMCPPLKEWSSRVATSPNYMRVVPPLSSGTEKNRPKTKVHPACRSPGDCAWKYHPLRPASLRG